MKKEIIIDLRENNDFKKSHLKDAINIPYEIMINGNFQFNKYECVKCYCYSGNKSNKICKYLSNNKVKCIDLGSFENAKKNII